MIDFKRFILLSVTLSVLFAASTKAMYGQGHGFDDDENQEEQELITGLKDFRLDNTAEPFFTKMHLRGYVTLQLINDTLSQLTISIKFSGSNQILSTTNLSSGTFHNVFIPEDTSFDLIATRDKVPNARPMVLTFVATKDIATRISRWGLARHSVSATVPTINAVNLFNVAPDPDHILVD